MRRATVIFHASVACVSWATANVLTKYLLGTVPPFTLLFMQVAASGLAVLVLSIFRHGVHRTVSAWRFVFLGVLQPGIAYGLSTYALQRTSASVEVLVWALDPALVLVIAWIVLSERPSRWLLAALCTCAIGSVLVGIGEAQSSGLDASLFVVGLIATGVVASAVYTVALGSHGFDEAVLPIIFWNQVGGLFIFLAAALAAQEATSPLPPDLLGVVALSGILLHALPFVLLALLLRKISVGSTGLITPAVSILTLVFAHFGLGERLATIQWFGCGLITIGTLLLPFAVSARPIGAEETGSRESRSSPKQAERLRRKMTWAGGQ